MSGKGKSPTLPLKRKGETNLQILTQSILDCRIAYSDLSDIRFSFWYQSKYGVKSDRVLEILQSLNSAPGGVA